MKMIRRINTHFALMGLTLAGYLGLEKIHPALGFVQKGLPQRIITGKKMNKLLVSVSEIVCNGENVKNQFETKHNAIV
jgi:hypothetical protein